MYNICRTRAGDQVSMNHIASDLSKSPNSLTNQHFSQEKERKSDLSFQLDEARREIRRLNQTIEKLSQREKNSIMYFQRVIKELQSANQEYKNRIDCYENNRERSNRSISMTHSKLNRSYLNLSIHPSATRNNTENKENMNTLNFHQNSKCNSPFCESKQELQQVKSLSTQTIKIINNLLYSLKCRQNSQWIITDFDSWAKQLESERSKRKGDANKTSLQLVKNIQQKLISIHECMENETEKKEFITQPFLDSLRNLKMKQKNLLKIPFLEKIDIIQRKQDADCFVESANLIKERIIGMLKNN